jgi:hypothetical protein
MPKTSPAPRKHCPNSQRIYQKVAGWDKNPLFSPLTTNRELQSLEALGAQMKAKGVPFRKEIADFGFWK